MKKIFFLAAVVLISFGCTRKTDTESTIQEKALDVDFRYQPREWQTCYGLKDDFYKSMVDDKGGLWYDFVYGNHIGFPYPNFCYERNKGYTLAIYPQVVDSPVMSEVKQEMVSARKPIIITEGSYGKISYRQVNFASFADDTNPLETRYDVCNIQLKNESRVPEEKALRLHFNTIHQVELGPEKKKAYLVKYGQEERQLIAEFPQPVERFAGHISKMKWSYYLDFPKQSMDPGSRTNFTFIVHRSADLPGFTFPLDLQKEQSKVEQYWDSQNFPYDRISVPDSGMQELLTSAIRNIYQAREIKEGIPAFQVGPTFYRGTWAVDGPFFMEAMAYLGQEDQVRQYIEGVFKVGESQGDRGESFSKQAGLRIWMVWRHAQLTGDYEWLEDVWVSVESEVENIKKYRANSYNDGNPLTNGMMPVGNADGGIGGHFAEYTNNYWVLSGLRMAIAAAKKLAKTEAVEDWQGLFDDYYAVFEKARDRDKLADKYGNTYVPTFMGHNTLNPTTGQWAFMHSIFPGKLYASDDALMKGTLAMLDSSLVEGLIWGTGWLPNGLWTYSASFHGHAHLWLGNGHRVPQILYDFANHASPLLCWSEEQHSVDFEGDYLAHGDMPHNWASVDFVRLIRHSLALERGNQLHMFEGLPEDWLKLGMSTGFKGVNTTFGKLSFDLVVNETGDKAALELELDGEEEPEKILIDQRAFNGNKELISFDGTQTISVEIEIYQ